LASIQEFAEAFQHSFENGIAMERMVTNTFACNTLVNYIKSHAGTPPFSSVLTSINLNE
jgi:hypothetical protein